MFDRFWHQTLGRPYRLHCAYHGDSTEPPIVLLHGIGVSGHAWYPVIKSLQMDNYCITVDLLGFGESPKPEWCEYDIDDHLKSVEYTLRKLGLKEPCILIGHSLGSMIAARYARRNPGKLTRLVMLSPPVYPALDDIKNPRVKRMTGLLFKAYEFVRSERMSPRLFDRLTRILPFPRDILDNPATWMPFMKTLEHSIEQQDVIRDVGACKVPTDVWYGKLDEFALPGNVELLGEYPHVTLHSFLGDHLLTRRYGRLVKAELDNTQN